MVAIGEIQKSEKEKVLKLASGIMTPTMKGDQRAPIIETIRNFPAPGRAEILGEASRLFPLVPQGRVRALIINLLRDVPQANWAAAVNRIYLELERAQDDGELRPHNIKDYIGRSFEVRGPAHPPTRAFQIHNVARARSRSHSPSAT